MIGGFIVEVIGYAVSQFIVEILFNRIISPFFKIVGSLARWLCVFGQTPYRTIYKKDYNMRLGLIVSLILLLIIMFVFYQVKI